jgi:hypothetical protein
MYQITFIDSEGSLRVVNTPSVDTAGSVYDMAKLVYGNARFWECQGKGAYSLFV